MSFFLSQLMAGYQAVTTAFMGSWALGSLAIGTIRGGLFTTLPFFTALLINNYVIGSSQLDSNRLRKLTCLVILGVFSASLAAAFILLDLHVVRVLMLSLLILSLASIAAFISRDSIDIFFAEKCIRDELEGRIQKNLGRMSLSNGPGIERNAYSQRLRQMKTNLGISSLSACQRAVFKAVDVELKHIEKWLKTYA